VAKTIATKTWRLAAGADHIRRSKPPEDNLAPTVPTGVALTVLSSSSIRIDWTASTDSQSGIAYYIIERSPNGTTGWTQIGTPSAVTYADGSCAPATTYYYRIKAVDDATALDGSPILNTSAASAVVHATTEAGAVLQWTYLTPSSRSVIPGIAGWGTNTPGGSGRHLPTSATTLCVVDTLSNSRTTGTLTQSNPPVYHCSLPFALRLSVPRVIVFKVSGVIDLQRTELAIGRYMTIAGQTAPSPGIFIKNGSVDHIGGDQVLWHISNYNGDEASSQGSDRRRNFSFGAAGTSNYVAAWCSGFWSSDQAFDCSVGGSNFTIVHCFMGEGLCDSIHPKGQHGYGVLIEAGVTNVAFYRNIIAHFIERSPLTRAPNALIANNLVYNAKGQNIDMPNLSPTGKGGYGTNPQNYQSITSQTNFEGNLLIKGPNFSSQYGGTKQLFLQGQTSTFSYLPGSKLYLGSNHAIGFGTVTSQNDLWSSGGTLPANLIGSARISASFPDGMAVQDPTASGFAQLVVDTCGARPGDRAAGRESTVAGHIMNKLAGSGTYGTGINTPPGGPITAAANTRDIFNSTAMSGDPCPNGTDRDTIQASGYTKLEEWLYRQHLAVM
jgi:hypothetical protein